MDTEHKFCKHCQCDHPLTDEWWYFHRNRNGTQCKLKHREYAIIYRAKNKEKIKENRHSNKDKMKDYLDKPEVKQRVSELNKKYYNDHKPSISKARSARDKHKRRFDPLFKLSTYLRSRLVKSLKRNTKIGSFVADLGCTIEELKQYLESKFREGMAWDNWSTHGWHIDHVIPLASFDLTDREQFLKACHYTNLQPLWAIDNLRKGDRSNGD